MSRVLSIFDFQPGWWGGKYVGFLLEGIFLRFAGGSSIMIRAVVLYCKRMERCAIEDRFLFVALMSCWLLLDNI